ncbi:DUF45 domain-containing protein [Cobetia sp. 10Alg 146]|uniref:M48 metallopeptidase family protein n=1 Tax=Cobetia sp. 10Alg 146 TaxID=3040019 RepID=UPI002447F405|nr:YgjP-like metallopeptidase domain-containing protein [Cobetia sp. 10Alg 146]MDH2291611.1 DUF45 domain-containing protein [Cobetia sp. 10Alg 146]
MADLRYLKGYGPEIQQQASELLASGKTAAFFLARYSEPHQLQGARALHDYTMALKNQYLRSSAPISKVIYDDRIHVIDNALGLHTFVSRVQGNKLKAKHEIRISSLFRRLPEPLLNMIVVHELAHLREKAHDKAFYRLCCHMQPEYHQREFELRLYLCHRERHGDLW